MADPERVLSGEDDEEEDEEEETLAAFTGGGGVAAGEDDEEEEDEEEETVGAFMKPSAKAAAATAAAAEKPATEAKESAFSDRGKEMWEGMDELPALPSSFLAAAKPTLASLDARLAELQTTQLELLRAIGTEGRSLNALPGMEKVQALMAALPDYRQRAQRLKRTMAAVDSHLGKLSTRAAALCHKLDSEKLEGDKKRVEELERDKRLLARPSDSLLREESGDKSAE
eukprot:PLAT8554.1.p1 GENE.PLAT8554.1~~PLAT8554.1.p1  ORF type:complete len:238 (-),score=117.53 PLAT8554.1:50-733(-)